MDAMNRSLYQKARFLLSSPQAEQLPEDVGWEVAFAGRSNTGKSSAINCLTQQKSLARTSKTPGRTQHLVCFELDEERRLVDLPGYGYAKVPEKIKRQWQAMIDGYLTHRQSLQGIILMMDCRHPMKPFDEQMLMWQQHAGIPMHILLTKADKLTRGAAKNVLLQLQKTLRAESQTQISVQLFSATKKQGLATAYAVLNQWLHCEVEH